MKSKHYRVSEVMDTVKLVYYHNPDLGSFPGSYASACLSMGARGENQFYVCQLLVVEL